MIDMSAHPLFDVDDVDFYFKIQEEAGKAFILRSDRLAYRIREFKKCLRDKKVSHYFFYPDKGVNGVRIPDKTEVLVGLLDECLKSYEKFKEDWQFFTGQIEIILQHNGVNELSDKNRLQDRLPAKPKKSKDPLYQSLHDLDERKHQLNSLQGKFQGKEEEARSYILGLVPPGESIYLMLSQWSVYAPADSRPDDLESLLTLMAAHPMGLRTLLRG